MNCYVMNISKMDDQTFYRGADTPLTMSEIQQAFKSSKALVNKFRNSGVKKIKIYGSGEDRTAFVMSMIASEFIRAGFIKDEDIILDSAFNGRDYGMIERNTRKSIKKINAIVDPRSEMMLRADLNLDNECNIEKKKDFRNRVFDAMAGIVMENTENVPVVLLVGDEFISACQKDKDIHSMMFFGDEKFYIPNPSSKSYDDFNRDPYMTHVKSCMILNQSSMKSERKFPELSFSEVKLEAPEISSAGITPVYEKYARNNALRKIEEESQMGK